MKQSTLIKNKATFTTTFSGSYSTERMNVKIFKDRKKCESMETGLIDSNSQPIKIGDLVKMECTINQELHGKFCLYRVEQRGMIPVLCYEASERGKAVPRGYLGCLLSENYDLKLLMTGDYANLIPDNTIEVVDETHYTELLAEQYLIGSSRRNRQK
ncbi:MAG: hypothetical protein ACTS9Y_00480 [Methylophilus sp.]|uniref:hypothetical protein n=1 Tax=Methylophilus sp. TaxID=29541 RepID=UPI003F9FB34C